MHRFHLPPERWDSATLDPSESHHCSHVLRLDAGDRITVFDGCGREAQAVIRAVRSAVVSIEITAASVSPRPPAAITLAQAIPKGKNMDLVVQKAVELGAAAIVPLVSERTIVQLDQADALRKQGKWQEIALEACKQCGQNHLPSVALPVRMRDFLSHGTGSELPLIASLQPGARPLKSVLADFRAEHGRLPRTVTILIGPEGDFTPAETASAISSGCHPITLGPIILRTETAAIYCLSVLAHECFETREQNQHPPANESTGF